MLSTVESAVGIQRKLFKICKESHVSIKHKDQISRKENETGHFTGWNSVENVSLACFTKVQKKLYSQILKNLSGATL